MNRTKHNCSLCMLSMQCISYSSLLKTQLLMFSKCAQCKKQKWTRKATKLHYRDTILEGILCWELYFPVGHWSNASFLSSFRDMALTAQLVRWLYKLTSQVACEGLITESLRSTSISSFVTPDCIWVLIWLANQLVNWLNYKKKIAVNQKKSARCN